MYCRIGWAVLGGAFFAQPTHGPKAVFKVLEGGEERRRVAIVSTDDRNSPHVHVIHICSIPSMAASTSESDSDRRHTQDGRS